MLSSSPTAKIFQGVASRREMFPRSTGTARLRSTKGPLSGSHSVGEWFEIGEAETMTCSICCRRCS